MNRSNALFFVPSFTEPAALSQKPPPQSCASKHSSFSRPLFSPWCPHYGCPHYVFQTFKFRNLPTMAYQPNLPFQFTFESSITGTPDGPCPSSAPSALPILLFVTGLGSDPLPECQASSLRSHYNLISLGLKPYDQSPWSSIVSALLPKLATLRQISPSPIVLVSESFGVALAFRLIASCPSCTFSRQVVINPATGFHHDSFLVFASSLVPILQIDPTQRVLYYHVALIAFNYFLTDRSRLASSSFQSPPPLPRGIDIDKIPLSSLIHRISLLSDSNALSDDFLRQITLPTVLVAAARDRLLQSATEVERLSSLLPHVQHRLILPYSAHTALFEFQVSLKHMLDHFTVQYCNPSPVSDSEWYQVRQEAAVDLGKQLYTPWEKLIDPKVFGRDKVSKALELAAEKNVRSVLFVGTHSRCGIFDTSLIFLEISRLIGDRKLRAIADQNHFSIYAEISGGRWSEFVRDLGAVPATAKNFSQLLKDGEVVTLFPSGPREVARRRGEKDILQWKRESNFVRIAAKYNSVIVPFCTIGADDAVDIIVDGQELQKLPWVGTRVKNLLEKNNLSTENVTPVTTFPPRLDRFYFKFFEPIDTEKLDASDREGCNEEFDRIEKIVKNGIDELKELRGGDGERQFEKRLFGGLSKSISNAIVDALL